MPVKDCKASSKRYTVTFFIGDDKSERTVSHRYSGMTKEETERQITSVLEVTKEIYPQGKAVTIRVYEEEDA